MLSCAIDIGAVAVDSLLLEVDTWPKPGLVSTHDCGSHADMDAALLQRSAHTLGPFFVQLAQAGMRDADLPALRGIGLRAEQAMLGATGGINTHRGAIFGLGLLCAAAGQASVSAPRGWSLGMIVRRRWGEQIEPAACGDDSHGAQVWRRYGVGGARAQAASGFEHLYRIGWPALRAGRRLARGDEEAARVHVCFALMATLADTNLLHRGGAQGWLFARELAADFIERGGVGCADWRERALRAHREMVARKLSPGGCADLLAMTLFVDALCPSNEVQPTRCVRESALV
jgi:triphosphoribosyl-dephospho-CoA synthase